MSLLSPLSVTPAASVLSRCVARGALGQDEIDSALSERSPAFSSHLSRAEQRITAQSRLNQLRYQVELLQLDKQSADVTHPVHLTPRLQTLQSFSSHLQAVLKDLTLLRQRLLRPQISTHLSVPAHLHRVVVELIWMFLDLIETLEVKTASVQSSPSGPERIAHMDSCVSALLALAVEVQTVSAQLLLWKENGSSSMTDSSGRTSTSDPLN